MKAPSRMFGRGLSFRVVSFPERQRAPMRTVALWESGIKPKLELIALGFDLTLPRLFSRL